LSLAPILVWLLPIAAVAAEPDAWAPFQFLLGDWQAVAKPGEPTGRFSFSVDLEGKILVRRNRADTPATSGRAAGTRVRRASRTSGSSRSRCARAPTDVG
jgi:hypothetical protein